MTRPRVTPRARWGIVALTLFALAVPQVASAGFPIAPVVPYSGTMSDGGTVGIAVQSGWNTVSSFDFGGRLPNGCQTTFSNPYPVAPDGLRFGGLDRKSTNLSDVNVAAHAAPPVYHSVAGIITANAPGECGPHLATWVATTDTIVPPRNAFAASSTYSGGLTPLGGQTAVGTGTLTVDADHVVQSVRLEAARDGCTYALATDASSAAQVNGASAQLVRATGSFAAVVVPPGLQGFVLLKGTGACPHLALTWSVAAAVPTVEAPATATPIPTPAPTPAPAAAGGGTFLAPPNFGTGRSASAVFGGGTAVALEAAVAAAGGTGAWVQDGSGAYHLLIVGAPAFLRDAFTAAFPVGIAGPVAVTLTR
ncbi:MAG: hypothetical protein AB7G21_04295 [Dehalococcoidia bacterium]